MEVHPLCKMFPEMTPEEYSELREDIVKHGQLEAITTHEGMILDGRNRYRACCNVGTARKFEEWRGRGGSPLRFVISRTLHRRNLTVGQRADIAAEIKVELEAEGQERMKAGGRKS